MKLEYQNTRIKPAIKRPCSIFHLSPTLYTAHRRIPYKHYGLDGCICQFNVQCFSPQTVCCGAPQGSILGPMVFLLYINDLNNVSTVVELILFADDANLFICPKRILSPWQPNLIPNLINDPLGFRQTLLKPVENKLYAI